MSPTRGRPPSRQAPPRRLDRPSLDRPSLFAGMEAGDSIVPEDDDPSHGGILSTLESVRNRKTTARQRGRSLREVGGQWVVRALMAAVGVGVATLLGAFVMIVNEGHSRSMAMREASLEREAINQNENANAPREVRDLNVLAEPAAGASAPVQDAPSATPAKSADPQAQPLLSQAQSAVIVDAASGTSGGVSSPPAQVDLTPPAPVMAPMPAPTTAPVTAPVAATASTPAVSPAATTPVPQHTRTAQATPDKVRPRATARSHGKDADVDLLEDMFHHTQGLTAPSAGPSVADQLQRQCGGLSGAAAATCRARICVSNPSADACHE